MESKEPKSVNAMLALLPVHKRKELEEVFREHVIVAYTQHLKSELNSVELSTTKNLGSVSSPSKGTIPPNSSSIISPQVVVKSPYRLRLEAELGHNEQSIINRKSPRVPPANSVQANELQEKSSVIDLSNSTDSEDDDKESRKKKYPKNDHGLDMVESCDTNSYLEDIKSKHRIKPHIKQEPIKLEDTACKATYHNVEEFITTALFMTGLFDDNKDSIRDITNIGDRKELRSSDIRKFLEDVGVGIMKIDESYEKIMTSKNDSNPIVIEYTVSRHFLEDVNLPLTWVQFCILLKKENLLLPFNATGQNIKFGKQFINELWTGDFESYSKQNLNFRIAPVDRRDSKGLKKLVRTLEFNQAWTMHIPTE